MQYSLLTLAIIVLTFTLAGMVKGVIGMGLPTVAMGVLGLLMGPVQAAALMVVPSLVTNVWQLIAGPSFIGLVRRFGLMMIGLFFGSIVGVKLLTHGAGTLASVALGIVLAAYGLFGLSRLEFSVSPRWERRLSPLAGVATGLLSGATGLAVIPAVPYLNSLELDKEALIQTLGLTFTISTIGLGLGLAAAGQFQASVAGTSLLALLPALGGMFLGQAIRKRLQPEVFRRWFFLGMLALGIYMVVRALG